MDTLERRLQLWERGKNKSLVLEAESIHQRLTSNNDLKNIANVWKKFAKLMGKGNISGALKLLRKNMTNGVLPLDEKNSTHY